MNVVEMLFNEPISFVKCHSFSVCVCLWSHPTPFSLWFSNVNTYHWLRKEVGGEREKIVFQNAQLDTSSKHFEMICS